MVSEGLQQCATRAVKHVPAGSTVALDCNSNDYEHNFLFWQFGEGKIIGPGNPYDENKYKYEVLSGKLFIKGVSPEESGCYNCYSKQVNGSGHYSQAVQMIVAGDETHQAMVRPVVDASLALSSADLSQHQVDAMDAIKLVAIVVSLIVIIGCAIIYYRLRRDWNKYDGRMVVPMDEDDEEEGDEIYNRTTTSINPAPGPSRNASSDQLYGLDNHGLDTDFNSVFQQIQIKSPQHSLI